MVTNMTGHMKVKGKLDLEKLVEENDYVSHSIKRIKKKKKDLVVGERIRHLKERSSKMKLDNLVQKGFNSVVLTIPTSVKKVSALCYPSGKLLLMGATSLENMEEAALTACVLLNKEIECSLRVSNVCGSGQITDAKFDYFDLGNLSTYINTTKNELYSCSYDSEIFPALIIYDRKTKGKCTIFKSGKANVTGTRTKQAMKLTYNGIKVIIKLYFKQHCSYKSPMA